MPRFARPVKPAQPLSLQQSLVATLLEVTEHSTHSYEAGVHRLLLDLIELEANGRIDHGTYGALLGTAIDVLFYFNYDPKSLREELNIWYRASIIHQLGQGMLQAIEKYRPELTARPFFQEARAALALHRQLPEPVEMMGLAAPLHCKQWA